MGLLVDSS